MEHQLVILAELVIGERLLERLFGLEREAEQRRDAVERHVGGEGEVEAPVERHDHVAAVAGRVAELDHEHAGVVLDGEDPVRVLEPVARGVDGVVELLGVLEHLTHEGHGVHLAHEARRPRIVGAGAAPGELGREGALQEVVLDAVDVGVEHALVAEEEADDPVQDRALRGLFLEVVADGFVDGGRGGARGDPEEGRVVLAQREEDLFGALLVDDQERLDLVLADAHPDLRARGHDDLVRQQPQRGGADLFGERDQRRSLPAVGLDHGLDARAAVLLGEPDEPQIGGRRIIGEALEPFRKVLEPIREGHGESPGFGLRCSQRPRAPGRGSRLGAARGPIRFGGSETLRGYTGERLDIGSDEAGMFWETAMRWDIGTIPAPEIETRICEATLRPAASFMTVASTV